jgi:acetyl-CoA carboxylase carboxyl transferase subunit alpha
MGTSVLEFEKPIAELERQIQELREKAEEQKLDLSAEIVPLQERLAALRRDTY